MFAKMVKYETINRFHATSNNIWIYPADRNECEKVRIKWPVTRLKNSVVDPVRTLFKFAIKAKQLGVWKIGRAHV